MSMQVVSPKTSAEAKTYTFDFASKLAAGETISTQTTTATVWSGVDTSPSAIISGAATVSNTKVNQNITGGVNGVVYKLSVKITTSTGQTLVINSYLAVVDDPI